MQRPRRAEVEGREGVEVVVVAAAHDGALAPARHDEGQRRFGDLSVMDRDAVGRRHVDEHAPEPVVGDLGQEVRRDPELGAGEGRRDRVAAEGDRVIAGHRLLVAGRQGVGEEGNVNVGLADEESLHREKSRRSPPAANRPAGGDPWQETRPGSTGAPFTSPGAPRARTGLRDPDPSGGKPWYALAIGEGAPPWDCWLKDA